MALINKIDHVEVATLDIQNLQKTFETFGFVCTQTQNGKQGEFRLLEQGHTKVLLSQGAAGTFSYEYAKKHGDGVCRLVFDCSSAKETYETTLSRGAQSLETLSSSSEGDLHLTQAAIAAFGDVRFTFWERKSSQNSSDFSKPFAPGFKSTGVKNNPFDAGMKSVDHLTNNVEMGTMDHWADFYKKVFEFVEARYFDIRANKTGLQSKVMQTPSGSVRIPINEATEEKSQVQEFINQHKGAGVQHIALTTTDIVATVRELKKRGIQFLDVPDTYYEMVAARVPNVKEDLNELKSLRILVDGDETGYLLQIFTQNQIGPLFFEVIQRRGHTGFGEGNFKALFEAIERDQERRGVL